MSIILLVGFNLFVSSSVPQGPTATDTPSGFSVMVGGEHKIKHDFNYDFIASYYSGTNYEASLHGLLIGKELVLGKKFSILPEIGAVRGIRTREETSEIGYSPLFLIRFAYLFSTENSSFQIGLSLREVFNEEIGIDFLDFGIGFRM